MADDGGPDTAPCFRCYEQGAAKLAPTLPVADDQLRSDNFMMYGLKVNVVMFIFGSRTCPASFLLSGLVQDESGYASVKLLNQCQITVLVYEEQTSSRWCSINWVFSNAS